MISNIDDHPRNHALLAKDKDWRLSPAYDLTPSAPISQERRDLSLDCGDMGRFGATWYDTVCASGVSEGDAETIRGAFVYPGFSL